MNAEERFNLLLAQKKRHFAVRALRQTLNLSSTFADLLTALEDSPNLGAVADDVRVGDLFDAVQPPDAPIFYAEPSGKAASAPQPVVPIKRPVGRPPGSGAPVGERLDLIVALVTRHGGWMRNAAILDALRDADPAFATLDRNTLSGYLTRICAERPPRLVRRGERRGTEYKSTQS